MFTFFYDPHTFSFLSLRPARTIADIDAQETTREVAPSAEGADIAANSTPKMVQDPSAELGLPDIQGIILNENLKSSGDARGGLTTTTDESADDTASAFGTKGMRDRRAVLRSENREKGGDPMLQHSCIIY